jgi:hypothetical protein
MPFSVRQLSRVKAALVSGLGFLLPPGHPLVSMSKHMIVG